MSRCSRVFVFCAFTVITPRSNDTSPHRRLSSSPWRQHVSSAPLISCRTCGVAAFNSASSSPYYAVTLPNGRRRPATCGAGLLIAGGPSGQPNPLHVPEFQPVVVFALNFQAEFDGLLDPFHQRTNPTGRAAGLCRIGGLCRGSDQHGR